LMLLNKLGYIQIKQINNTTPISSKGINDILRSHKLQLLQLDYPN
jgi:hypothetical protein